MIVGHQIEQVLFEVGARATDGTHLVLAYHLRKRQTEFSRTHCAGQGEEHLATLIQVRPIGTSGIF